MAIIDFPPFFLPEEKYPTVDPVFSTLLLDAAGEKAAFVLQCPKTGNIHKLHFGVSFLVTSTSTDVRLETVDATTGDPSGTLEGTNTNGTLAVVTDGWHVITLTADAAVTKGDLVALVIAPSGTPSYRVNLSNAGGTTGIPYTDHFAAAWTKGGIPPCCALEYDDGSFAYMPGTIPATALNVHAISNATDPDEIALKFTLPHSCRVAGAWIMAERDGDVDLVLYDSDGSSVLESVSLDTNISGFNTGRLHLALFDTPVTLLANTAYFLSAKPSSATALDVYSFDVDTAAVLDQMAGGQAFHYREAVNGTWDAALTTRRPFMGLIIDGIDVPAPEATYLMGV